MSHKNDGSGKSFTAALRFALPATVAILLLMIAGHVQAQSPESAENGVQRHSPLAALQHFVSRADGPRCPMVPSCSQYASQAFKQHNIFVGWMLTCDRLLRCGRDETRLAPSLRTPDGPRAQDPLSTNINWWKKSQ